MKAVFKTTGGSTPTPPTPPTPPAAPNLNETMNRPPRDQAISYPAGSLIFQEGELGTEMFIIQDGEVHITKKLRGETHLLSRLEKGDFFGEMSVIDAAPRSANALAATDVKVLLINGARFDEMIRKTPEIAIRIIRKYSKRLREANTMLEKFVGEEVHFDGLPASELADSDTGSAQPDDVHTHRLVDLATGTAFFLSRGDETTIGRADPVTGILPDVDLTNVDTNRSVSRRHAKILRAGAEYLILEEVGTVNGTYVNDQRIPTGQPVGVRNGDQVKIGLIEMKAVFE